MAMRGHEEGIAQIEEDLTASGITGLKMVQPYKLCMLAEVCGKFGRFEKGLAALAEALTVADENEDRFYEPETYRLKGMLLLRQNDSSATEAENCFRKAIDVAQQQKAKSWELRATTSLAGLLAKQGHRADSHAMLAEIYGWFTEGFDTADLKDAKALLEESGA